jgi:CBS domain containing-hemolysin-like protein
METTYYGYRFLALALIIGVNGFFSASEVALLSVRVSRLRQMAKHGSVGAQAALSLLSNPERLLSVIQVGVTVASLGLGWAGQDTVYRFLTGLLSGWLDPRQNALLHGASFGVGFLLITSVHVVAGEVVPKNLAIEKADRLAVLVAPLLLVFYRIAEPFVLVLERSASFLSHLIGLKRRQRGGGHSAEELKLIVSSARGEGELPEFEEDTINRILDLENLSVREIMVPRNNVVSVSVEASLEEIFHTMMEHQYSRLPVYEGRPEQIIGILHYKDLLRLHEDLRRFERVRPAIMQYRLRSLLRKPPVVPETKPVSQMADEFRRARVHMAIVVDEFGTIVGIVTMEDFIEQFLGEVEDEQDLARSLPPEASTLDVDGTISIRDLETQYGIELPADAGFETLAGYLLLRLRRIPSPGDHVQLDDRRFTVLLMDRNRIAKVRIDSLGRTKP